MQQSNLEILLQDALAGDAKSFELIQQQFERSIHRFASRMLASLDDVDDVVQQTFIALYMNLDQIDPPEKLRPFLFRVARNLCYDNLRRVYRRDDVSINDCEYRLSSNHISPEENAHWRLMLAGVRQAIDCLPEIHRDTLILYVEEGLSQAEIAEVMHTELGTVKSRLYYARKLLRQLVSPDTLLAIENTK